MSDIVERLININLAEAPLNQGVFIRNATLARIVKFIDDITVTVAVIDEDHGPVKKNMTLRVDRSVRVMPGTFSSLSQTNRYGIVYLVIDPDDTTFCDMYPVYLGQPLVDGAMKINNSNLVFRGGNPINFERD